MADIRINRKHGLVVWQTPIKKLAKNMTVEVEDGCKALLYIQGTLLNEISGESKVINEGNALGKLYGKHAEAVLLCFSTDAVEVKWGIGKSPAMYLDKRCNNTSLGVTAYGKCSISVINGKLLISKMPASFSDGSLDGSEIVDFIHGKITAKISGLLAADLEKLGDYTVVRSKMAEISDRLAYAISGMEELGLRVTGAVIEQMDFTDDAKAVIAKVEESHVRPIDAVIAGAERDVIDVVLGDSKKKGDN